MAELPSLGAAVGVVTKIYDTVEKIKIHKEQCIHLRERAKTLLVALQESMEKEVENDEIRAAVDNISGILWRIHKRMSEWATYGRVKGFVKQADITRDIEVFEKDLDMAAIKFSITTMIEVNRAQAAFKASQARDHAHLTDMLRTIITNTEDLNTISKMEGEPEAVESIMESIQTELYAPVGSKNNQQEQRVLRNSLMEIRDRTGILPPLANLTGEIEKIGDVPAALGSSADIWRGEWLGEEVALKSLRNIEALNDRTERKLRQEIEIWRSLDHPNVLQLYGICYFGPYIHMVSPWAYNRDALKYLASNPDVNRVKLLAEVASGLAYLHSRSPPIIHGDLRAANILILESGEACVSDFGMSRLEELSESQTNSSMNSAGAVRWMAPELVNPSLVGRRSPTPSTAADIWSFGMVCFEFFTSQKPYSHHTLDIHVLQDIQQGVRHPRPRGTPERLGLSDAVWRLMQDCWCEDAHERPPMSHVAERLKIFSVGRRERSATSASIPAQDIHSKPPGRSATVGPRISLRRPAPVQISLTAEATREEEEEENHSEWLRGTMEGLFAKTALPDTSSTSVPLFSTEKVRPITYRYTTSPQRTTDPLPSPPNSPDGHYGSPYPESSSSHSTLESSMAGLQMGSSSLNRSTTTTGLTPPTQSHMRKSSVSSSVGKHSAPPISAPSGQTGFGSAAVQSPRRVQSRRPTTADASTSSFKAPVASSSKSVHSYSGDSQGSPFSPPEPLPLDSVELKNDGATVVAGTLNGLVKRMVVTDSINSRQSLAAITFRDTFLTMYPAFTTAEEVLDALIEQYRSACEMAYLRTEHRINIRYSVVDIIEEWISRHRIEGADAVVLERMRDFVSELQEVTTIAGKTSRLIKDVINPRLTGLQTVQPGSASIYERSIRGGMEAKLSQTTHHNLAYHLTIVDSLLYMAIKATDVVAWLQQMDGEAMRTVTAFQHNQARLTAWVQKLILKVTGGADDRVAKIVYFTSAAKACYDMGNFSSMSAIVLALRSMYIGRLNQTNKRIPKDIAKQLRAMAELLDHTHNYSKYRRALSDAKGPVIPFFLVHLRDIRSTHLTYPGTIMGNNAVLINFQRYAKTLDEVKSALQFQQRVHELEPDETVMNLIRRQLGSVTPGGELEKWMETTSLERQGQEGKNYMSKEEALKQTGFL